MVTGYSINWGDGHIDYFGTMNGVPAASPAHTTATHSYDPNGGLPLPEYFTVTLKNAEGYFFTYSSVTVDNVAPTASFANSGGSPIRATRDGQLRGHGRSPADLTAGAEAPACAATARRPMPCLATGAGPDPRRWPTLSAAMGPTTGSGISSSAIVPAERLSRAPGVWTIASAV